MMSADDRLSGILGIYLFDDGVRDSGFESLAPYDVILFFGFFFLVLSLARPEKGIAQTALARDCCRVNQTLSRRID